MVVGAEATLAVAEVAASPAEAGVVASPVEVGVVASPVGAVVGEGGGGVVQEVVQLQVVQSASMKAVSVPVLRVWGGLRFFPQPAMR